MSVHFCVVSIGALSQNRLWGETQQVRTGHATTTYVDDGKKRILVDPSLPAQVLAARFNERTGRKISDVTDVFCTTLRPVHRRGIEAFDGANWWVGEKEIESYRQHLLGLADSADRLSGDDAETVQAELKLLDKFKPAPDDFGSFVSLYPLPGPSAGSTGLLITPPEMTVVVAGDAAVTAEHVERGQIWRGCADTTAAAESLSDLIQIADLIIPGHDNLMITPRQRWI